MEYSEAIDYIHSILKFGSKLGLTNITELMRRLGNPQNKFKAIHVAGTNGKGSTSVMLSEILRRQGYKTGLFTSPYIEDFCERIQINGEKISHDELAHLTEIVKSHCEEMVRDGFNHPTEFEVVTAIGFLYFSDCDYAVIEVGLGGRLDATNVLTNPVLSVITLIDYDHMEYLGDTLTEIAYEKCGIIKPGVPVVTYPEQSAEALEVIKNTCRERGCRLTVADSTEKYKSYTLKPSLSGNHQIKNMQTVISAVSVLTQNGAEICDTAVVSGIEKTQFIGRFEFIDKNIVIDGAHNPSGVSALCDCLREQQFDRIILVCGMLADKNYKECAEMLKNVGDVLIATEPPNPRKLDAKDFAEVLSTDLYFQSPSEAVSFAKAMAREDDLICVCGSLYLIGSIRLEFRNDKFFVD